MLTGTFSSDATPHPEKIKIAHNALAVNPAQKYFFIILNTCSKFTLISKKLQAGNIHSNVRCNIHVGGTAPLPSNLRFSGTPRSKFGAPQVFRRVLQKMSCAAARGLSLQFSAYLTG
jgi:hypothetical protein